MKTENSLPITLIKKWFKELCEFGSIPNNVFQSDQIKDNAVYLQKILKREGFAVQTWDTPSGKPFVFANIEYSKKLPTLLIYSHFDGVPVDRDQWSTDPFVPTIKNITGEEVDVDKAFMSPEKHRVYARSIADSKNAVISILAALDRLKSQGVRPGVNLKILLDGEEELESPYLRQIVVDHQRELEADIVISASGEMHQSGQPTIAFGVRGALTLDLHLYTATSDMHSGHFGGFTPNAALEMARLLANMKSKDGKVLISGFYNDVKKLTNEELRFLEGIPKIEKMICDQFAIRQPEQAYSLQELINMPAFNVRGLQAGYVGEKASNIIPTYAQASLDIRLVSGMKPEKILQSIIKHIGSEGVHVSTERPSPNLLKRYGSTVHIEPNGSFKAMKTDMFLELPGKILQVVQQSGPEAWVVEPTEGGSLNFEIFQEHDMPLITLPVSNYDCNQHTHNENLRLDYFLRGIKIFRELFEFKSEFPFPAR
ncbi:MAG: M20/M25/M40 family metallo-hydrolase [Gillisia sp.]